MYKYYNWQDNISEDELREVVEILNSDGVIIFPTETVYGIGGNALSNSVVDKVYEAKKRPRDKAVNILVANTDQIEKYAEITSDIERKIINNFMPGPITIILKKKANFGDYFTQDDDTIGVRIPNQKIINAILDKIDYPLIAPSANISGKESGIEVEQIKDDFKDSVDAIIDGGKSKLSVSSTIVKVVDGEVVILREGNISKEEILKIIIGVNMN